MGAKGVHQTITQLESRGFRPIELERYCGSNKIWSTKVKRLRLPDLSCVKTGLRVEVRAKSALSIKMSDAPCNADRAWDAGLRDCDLAAFITCFNESSGPVAAPEAMFVRIDHMRDTVLQSKLGPAKSASEGAERDRVWPTTVPKRAGEVVEVTDTKIVVRQFATRNKKERRQTYQLNGKSPYVNVGDHFDANICFLAGVPQALAIIDDYCGQVYDPAKEVTSDNPVNRYAAVKSLPHRQDNEATNIALLERLIESETEERIRLEAAGSATYFGSALGQDTISEIIWGDDASAEMRMEAILILTELGASAFVGDLLEAVASSQSFHGNEIRQAAVWGLGKSGLKNYSAILPYIADVDENVSLHAIAAFGHDISDAVIDVLIGHLISGHEQLAPASSEVLRIVGSTFVINNLMLSYEKFPHARNWIVATLGRMSPEIVRSQIGDHEVMQYLEPIFLNAPGSHWLSSEQMTTDISFLLKQDL